jgi:methionyl-tRNA synthetase
VLFPALWLAYDPDINLAQAFVTNEFLRLDGAKFSTSRGHAIWGHEILSRVPADVLRFYLAWSGPEREQTNFILGEMEATVERELGSWQEWLRDLGARVERVFDGVTPWSGAWTDEHQQFFLAVKRIATEVATAYEAESFSPSRAVRQLAELVRLARRFAEAESHWVRVARGREEVRNAFALELSAARALALFSAPVMPGFSARLWQALGYKAPAGPLPWEEIPELLPGGHKVSGLATFTVAEAPVAVLQVA